MKSTSSSSSYTVLYMHAALYNVIYRLLLQRTTSYRLLARSMRLGRRCPSYFTHTKINAVTCRGARIFNISVRSLSNLTVYRATPNNMKLVHWPLMAGMLQLVQRGGDWAGPQPAQAAPRCTKCNIPHINGQCTNHRIAV